jgi:hypothetical protein
MGLYPFPHQVREHVRERFDLRILERRAREWLQSDEGKRIDEKIRRLLVWSDDPIIPRIWEAQRHYITHGTTFFYGWKIFREYTDAELAGAEIFQLIPVRQFQMAGEQYGTTYDEFAACPFCGARALQVGPLRLDCGRLANPKDFNVSLAGELVVSARVALLFVASEITGVRFAPVICAKTGLEAANIKQLVITDHNVHIVAPTVIGTAPFEDPSQPNVESHYCREGDVLGLNVLSEAYLDRSSWGTYDLALSNEFVGTRGGLIRPSRLIFASPKVRDLVVREKLSGVAIEVAHLL